MAQFSIRAARFFSIMRKIASIGISIIVFMVIVSFTILRVFPVEYERVTPYQTAADGLEEVVASLNSADVAGLARHIDDHVQLTLPDKGDSYSKAQAVMILKDFFAGNGVTRFEVKHKGENSGSQFCVGLLITRSGDYRTTVFMKNKNGVQVLKEIRFQPM